MAIIRQGVSIDSTGREVIVRGTADFPLACYSDNLSQREVNWRWHDDMELFVVTEGCAEITIGNERYILTAGNGCFVNSGVIHSMIDRENSGCKYRSIVFHPSVVGGSVESIYYQAYVMPVIQNESFPFVIFTKVAPWHRDAVSIIEKVWLLCETQPAGYHITVRNLLSEFVFMVCSNMPQASLPTTEKTARNAQRIKKMLAFIHSNYTSEIDIQTVADSASLSKSECLRCFKNTVGVTPALYIRNYRIHCAAIMLETTTEKISVVGEKCGFTESSYFIKVFKEQKGVTPAEYRELHRQ